VQIAFNDFRRAGEPAMYVALYVSPGRRTAALPSIVRRPQAPRIPDA